MCVIFLPPDDGWDTMIPGGPVLIITHPDDFIWGDDWVVAEPDDLPLTLPT